MTAISSEHGKPTKHRLSTLLAIIRTPKRHKHRLAARTLRQLRVRKVEARITTIITTTMVVLRIPKEVATMAGLKPLKEDRTTRVIRLKTVVNVNKVGNPRTVVKVNKVGNLRTVVKASIGTRRKLGPQTRKAAKITRTPTLQMLLRTLRFLKYKADLRNRPLNLSLRFMSSQPVPLLIPPPRPRSRPKQSMSVVRRPSLLADQLQHSLDNVLSVLAQMD
ncbi:hypothetical protein E4T44_11203 [Aureobasidium sp. EXF-8845]|nr:hypothetical protein E4T45_11111 [Aureobasidium sp. EXF-8846]KAI4807096.1 hypothetical protein E4T44_11203 [Aureobasidium sp. EXF-8845]